MRPPKTRPAFAASGPASGPSQPLPARPGGGRTAGGAEGGPEQEPSAGPAAAPRGRRAQLQDTRARLLRAAAELIVAGGVAEASIRGVCRRAGFTQGAFYASFPDKDALLLALLEESMTDAIARLGTLLEGLDRAALGDSVAALAAALTELGSDTMTARLAVELHLHARRDPGIAAAHGTLLDRYHTAFSCLLAHLAQRHHRRLTTEPRQLSRTLHALWLGCVVDPEAGPGCFRPAAEALCLASLGPPPAAS